MSETGKRNTVDATATHAPSLEAQRPKPPLTPLARVLRRVTNVSVAILFLGCVIFAIGDNSLPQIFILTPLPLVSWLGYKIEQKDLVNTLKRSLRKPSQIFFGLVAACALVLLTLMGVGGFRTYTLNGVTVLSKHLDVHPRGGDDYYLDIELSDGSVLNGVDVSSTDQFQQEDVYDYVREDHSYDLTVRGLNIPYISMDTVIKASPAR